MHDLTKTFHCEKPTTDNCHICKMNARNDTLLFVDGIRLYISTRNARNDTLLQYGWSDVAIYQYF